MKRLAIFFLTLIFSVQAAGIPVAWANLKAHKKCCCGLSGPCRCAQTSGKFCPLMKKAQPAAKLCHLKKQAAELVQELTARVKAAAMPFLKAGSCGSDNQYKIIKSQSLEFTPAGASASFYSPVPFNLHFRPGADFGRLPDLSLDKPPQPLLLSF